MFGFTEEDLKQTFDNLFEEFGADGDYDPFDQPDLSPPGPDTKPLNAKWVRTLFRRTAQALHPDKEADPSMREHKHHLMSQLLEAREREDIMTMLTLYNEHVEGGDFTVAEQDADTLCLMLKKQIVQMEDELDAYFEEHPYRKFAYDRLHSPTTRGRQRRLKDAIKSIHQQIEMTDDLRLHLRNLNCLKDALRLRYDERHSFDIEYY